MKPEICAYCGQTIDREKNPYLQGGGVPDGYAEEWWAREAELHLRACEWVKTRSWQSEEVWFANRGEAS